MKISWHIRLILAFALGACLMQIDRFNSRLQIDFHGIRAQIRLEVGNNSTLSPSGQENASIAVNATESPTTVKFRPPPDCGQTFKTSRQVFEDNACYPRTFSSTPKSPRRIDDRKRTNSIELFTTQNWKSAYTYEFEKFRAEPAVLKSFNNAIVFRSEATTYVKSDEVWTASMRCLLSETQPRQPPDGSRLSVIDEAVLSASQIWGEGYYHMLVEKAFMLAPARQVIEGNPNSKIIFEWNYPALTQFLQLIGIDPSRIVIVGAPVKVKKLHMGYYSVCGYDSAENTQLMRQWIREENPEVYNKEKEEIRDIVMIDRSEAGCKRCILNTREVVEQIQAAFPDRKVRVMVAGRMSVFEQMKMLANAEVFVAPHGAGLTNLIFLPDHGKVVEIENHPGYFHPGYYELSLGLDLFYRSISPLKVGPNRVDFNRADPQQVINTIKDLFSLDSSSTDAPDDVQATLSPTSLLTSSPTLSLTPSPTLSTTSSPTTSITHAPVQIPAKWSLIALDDEAEATSPTACARVFKTSRQVFEDDACYPRTLSFTPRSPRRIDDNKITNSIEIFRTQNWNSFYIYRNDKYRGEPAVVKTFNDALVYRLDQTTYVKSNEVWTASMRCLLSETGGLPPPDMPVLAVIDEAVLSASQIWGHGYYHMLVEKAFMLGPARKILESNPNSKVIIEENFGELLQFLQLLGIDPNRIMVLKSMIKVTKLHMTYFSQCGFDGPENVQQTRKWIRDKNPDVYKNMKAARNIVMLDRSETGCNRCLRNTADVIRELQLAFPDRHVMRMVAGKMTVEQQMRMIADCEIFIAPHGAGLTNLIFLPDHGKVVEIENHPGYFHIGFYELALGLDLLYKAISPLKLSESTVDYGRADPQHVINTIKELLALESVGIARS